MQAGVDAAQGVHRGVFRAVDLALGQQLGLHQGVVGFQCAGHQRRRRRLPGQWRDRAGSEGQVARRASDQHEQEAEEFLHLDLPCGEVGRSVTR
ncbi:hypothetical protein D3C84_1023230 [compost metagenome]